MSRISRMGVKVKELRPGQWFVVIYQGGGRKTKKCRDRAHALEFAETLERIWKADQQAAVKQLDTRRRLTVGEFADIWLKDIESMVKPATFRSYRSNVDLYLRPALGHVPLEMVNYASIKRLVRQHTGKAKDTIRLMVYTLRALLEEARREGLIEHNPALGTSRLYRKAESARELDPFSPQEIAAMEEVASEYNLFIRVLSRTGMRFGEARALQWDDWDEVRSVLLIRRNAPATGTEVHSTKTGKTREVPLTADLQAGLRGWHRLVLENALRDNVDPSPYVFANPSGTLWDYSKFSKAWKRILKKAKVRYRNPHTLRDSFASNLISAGENPAYVAELLGHATVATTFRKYTKWIEESRQKQPRVNIASLYSAK